MTDSEGSAEALKEVWFVVNVDTAECPMSLSGPEAYAVLSVSVVLTNRLQKWSNETFRPKFQVLRPSPDTHISAV